MSRKIKKVIIHCSASPFGDVIEIDRWHRQRGWSGIGYHSVITNGILKSGDKYKSENDGLLQRGRKSQFKGAHCRGHNDDSLGVCLIGNTHFTSKQFITLKDFLRDLMKRAGISVDDIYCHYEFNSHKTCPNIDIELIRDLIR